MSKPVAIIGDTHGCFDEFLLLDAKLTKKFPGGIRRIFVGDILDKGPKQIELLDYIIEKNYEVVMGNHEDKHRRLIMHDRKVGREDNPMRYKHNGQPKSRSSKFAATSDALNSKHYEFLCKLPLAIRVPTWDLTVVHAGIPGNVRELPDFVFGPFTDIRGKDKHKYGALCWTRFISSTHGVPVHLGKNMKEDPYWAEVYNGAFGTVIFGHQPFTEPARFRHAVGIDTGCAMGNKLTCVVFSNETPQGSFLSVDSLGTYEEYYAATRASCVNGEIVMTAIAAGKTIEEVI